jgi:hypothetical protein
MLLKPPMSADTKPARVKMPCTTLERLCNFSARLGDQQSPRPHPDRAHKFRICHETFSSGPSRESRVSSGCGGEGREIERSACRRAQRLRISLGSVDPVGQASCAPPDGFIRIIATHGAGQIVQSKAFLFEFRP